MTKTHHHTLSEVIFFSYGDSNKASTWSNVPYLFSKHIEKRGIAVRRINLDVLPLIWKVLDHTLLKLIQVFFPCPGFSFGRTNIWLCLEERIIKKALMEYPNADLCIFTCYEHYNRYNDIPALLFSDWSYKILVEEKQKRKPFFFEKSFYDHQETVINNAEYVVCLFSNYAEIMRKDYPQANIHFLGGNVINSFYSENVSGEFIIPFKKKNRVLFVGKKYYKEGLLILIEAFKELRNVIKDAELHVIGMTSEQAGTNEDFIQFHGYLKKDDEIENKVYYDLLKTSGVVVNTTPNWGGYSSIIEAMFFYTPVLVTPFASFVDEFGKTIDFGKYVPDLGAKQISSQLISILQSREYDELCKAAHERVKDYTWDSYLDRMFALVTDDKTIC